MNTDFAKALAKGENIIGKQVVLLYQDNYLSLTQGNSYTITDATWVPSQREVRSFKVGGVALDASVSGNDFEFKHVFDKQKEPVMRSSNYYHSAVIAQYYDSLASLKEQLEGATEINKQYEQQIQMLKDDLFNLQMENARLDLAAQRWQMFDCEANRNIADKLLKKLADDAVETR